MEIATPGKETEAVTEGGTVCVLRSFNAIGRFTFNGDDFFFWPVIPTSSGQHLPGQAQILPHYTIHPANKPLALYWAESSDGFSQTSGTE